MRTAAQRDKNEDDIVKALLSHGCIVEKLSGRDVPDLLVWSPFTWHIVLLEVKRPRKKLRVGQARFFERWRAAGAPVHRVEDVAGALVAIEAATSPAHAQCRNCDGNGWVTSKRDGGTFKSLCPGFAMLGADLGLSKSTE